MAGGAMPRGRDDIPESAKYTAATWHWGRLPYAAAVLPDGARHIFRIVNFYMAMYRLINPRKHSLPHTLLHRHLMINRLLEASPCRQVIEFAAGFSPRGAAVSETADRHYVEVDLAPVVQRKRALLLRSAMGRQVLARNNFTQLVGDVTRFGFAQHVAAVPSFVISEGLMMYFERNEQLAIWRNVADFLHRAGGCYVFDYIPCDAEPPRSRVGDWLHRRRRQLGLPAHDYSYDERTRWQVRDDLLAAGFDAVELFDSAVCAPAWHLPAGDRPTQVLVYCCRV